MSRLNKFLLSLTIFLILAIVGTAILLLQNQKLQTIEKKEEVLEIFEPNFVHYDWPLTIDPDFIPGALPITSSSEVESIETLGSAISSISSVYSQRSSSNSVVLTESSDQISKSSKSLIINSIVQEPSSKIFSSSFSR
jgi:hypothetical protein